MQVNPDNSPKSEYLPDQIHSDQVPTWAIVQNLSEYLMPNPGSYSFMCNVLYARDPSEAHIYCQRCSREYKTSIHQLTMHTYRNAVIFMPVD